MNLARYLILSTICMSFSYAIFSMLFRNGTRFRQQRVFLIVSVVLSILLPLADFRIEIPGLNENTTVITGGIQLHVAENPVPASTEHNSSSIRDYADLFLYIYMIITAFFILVVAFQIIKLLWLIRISGKEQHKNILILSSEKIKSPFSFFNRVFIPDNLSDPEERQSIIIHESVHADQYHSIDNLIVELATTILWFNPVIWMIKKSLHLVHEYLADEGTLNAGIEKIRYQTLLLNQVAEDKLIHIPSGFNNDLLKKRMIMMTKSKSTEHNRFKILNLLSLSSILFLTVALLNGLFPQEIKAVDQEVKRISKTETRKDRMKNKEADQKEITVVGYELAGTDSLAGSLEGKTVVGYKLVSQEPLTVVGYALSGEDSLPGNPEERTVTGYKIESKEPLTVVGYASPSAGSKTGTQEVKKKNKKADQKEITGTGHKSESAADSVNYIVDGIAVRDISIVNPDSIESVNVLKADRTIIVRTKSFARTAEKSIKPVSKFPGTSETFTIRAGNKVMPENLLYIIDGKVVTKDELHELPVDKIMNISVIKDKNKIKLYTDKEYDGMVMVNTKSD